MSILVKEVYASPTRPLWASASGGGGGGNYVPLTSVNISGADTVTYATALLDGGTETIYTEAITLPDGLWQFNMDFAVNGTLASTGVGYFTLLVLYYTDDGLQYGGFARDFSVQLTVSQAFNLRLQIPVVDAVAKNGTLAVILSNATGADMDAGWFSSLINYSKILLTTDFTYVPPPP